MNEIEVDYNTLSAAKKDKATFYRVRIKNHPDFPPGEEWVLEIPKELFTLLNA